MRGQFTLFPGTPYEYVLPNTIVDEGEKLLLDMMFRGNVSDVALDGNFYIGLCGNGFDETTTLATLVGEPAVSNGYARQPVPRSSVGWPTLDLVNGTGHVRSQQVIFSASGGDFSTAITRAFLCTVDSGTSGKLISISAGLPTSMLITSGSGLPVAYDLYLN